MRQIKAGFNLRLFYFLLKGAPRMFGLLVLIIV